MNVKHNSGQKIICLNRKASFNYFFYELIEADYLDLKNGTMKTTFNGRLRLNSILTEIIK